MTPEPGRPTRVIVDDFELNGVDEFGVVWRFEAIDGWFSNGPGTDVKQVQRLGHGQFAQEGRRTGRVLPIKGRILAEDRALIPPALDRLNAVLADGGFGRLEVHDRTQGMRWTMVQLLQPPDAIWRGGPVVESCLLQFLSADAYKYGAVSQDTTGFYSLPSGVGLVYPLHIGTGSLSYGATGIVDGIATVSNPGTADAPAVFTVEGPTPVEGFSITAQSTGRRIVWLPGEVIPDSSSVVLDGTDGSVTIDGVADRRASVLVEEWPVVPAGGEEGFLFASEGSVTGAAMTAAVTATYW